MDKPKGGIVMDLPTGKVQKRIVASVVIEQIDGVEKVMLNGRDCTMDVQGVALSDWEVVESIHYGLGKIARAQVAESGGPAPRTHVIPARMGQA